MIRAKRVSNLLHRLNDEITAWQAEINQIKKNVSDAILITDGLSSDRNATLALLSEREREIFGLLGNDLGVGAIALRLKVVRKTVEAHREHMKKKLGLVSSDELAELAKKLKE
jgi:DNA-binding CsgD family transcriptional regulator